MSETKANTLISAAKTINHLCSVYIGYRSRVTTKVAKQMMLDGESILVQGRNCQILSKALGAGIHEVWLEERWRPADEKHKQGIQIRFNGALPGRFVTVETLDGSSIKAGKWIKDSNGEWLLVIN